MLKSGALAKGLDIGSKAINSGIGKKLIGEGMKHAPELYKHGKSRVKNKTLNWQNGERNIKHSDWKRT